MSTERPILFSGPLVRAILAGEKTVTRRLVKPQPPVDRPLFGCVDGPWGFDGPDGQWVKPRQFAHVGDVLWVRETWGLAGGAPVYRAEAPVGRENTVRELLDDGRWRPSIHMPRKHARLRLEVTDVRPERLQAITREDILAEGVGIPALSTELLREAWVDIWDAIYGAKPGQSWADNPWVWRVAFRVREVRR